MLPLLPQEQLKLRRFFLPGNDLAAETVTISGELFHHMVRSLRLQCQDRVILADGHCNEAIGSIAEVSTTTLRITILERRTTPLLSRGPAITLYQGMPKGDKMDLIVQKCTELGIAGITIFTANRSIPRLEGKHAQQKIDRWQRIAREAARQSNQATIPTISLASDLSAAISQARQTARFLVWEAAAPGSLRNLLADFSEPATAAIIIGPEGGITNSEAESAMANGFQAVSLGERILRSETAGLAILAILQYHWGELG